MPELVHQSEMAPDDHSKSGKGLGPGNAQALMEVRQCQRRRRRPQGQGTSTLRATKLQKFTYYAIDGLGATLYGFGGVFRKQAILTMLAIGCVVCFGYTQAVAECTSGNKLNCFECNSHIDINCADPFNWTTLPPTKECDGCCVKIVQGIDTPDYKIRRSCTESLDINMFMVDHVCMSEGGGKGVMCFCEDDECNSATSVHPDSSYRLVLVPYGNQGLPLTLLSFLTFLIASVAQIF